MSGMNSERLSARSKQPGHDRTFVASESNFITAARIVLDPERYVVDDHPRDLTNIFRDASGALGVVPEAGITSRSTGRKLFVEVKKQGPAGNADERACKHHTVQFYKTLHAVYGYNYHPFVTVFCENLSTDRRYTLKATYLFEPNQYFLWVGYDVQALGEYLRGRCTEWLD
jgi:hypothetical protein